MYITYIYITYIYITYIEVGRCGLLRGLCIHIVIYIYIAPQHLRCYAAPIAPSHTRSPILSLRDAEEHADSPPSLSAAAPKTPRDPEINGEASKIDNTKCQAAAAADKERLLRTGVARSESLSKRTQAGGNAAGTIF